MSLTPVGIIVLGAAFLAALGLISALRSFPRLAIAGWICVVAFVPIWFAVPVVFTFQPGSAAGILVLATLWAGHRVEWGLPDLVVAFFFVACVAPMLIGRGSVSTVFGALALWLVAFLLGRVAPSVVPLDWIVTVIVVVFTIVALLAVLEYLLHWNPFVGLGPGNGLHAKWGNIQTRAGQPRSEGAFGHSIALGATLAMVIPITLASRITVPVRLLMVAVMGAGVAFTLSRTSLICAAIGVALVVVAGRTVDRPVRVGAGAALAVGAVLVVPFLTTLLVEAGDEAANSAAYRGNLLSLLPDVAPLGQSPALQQAADGAMYFGGFQSIDSQLILTGLQYGAIALGVAVLLLAAAAGLVATGRASGPTIAVLAQVPALATVALITQYSLWFWFVAGLAVSAQAAMRRSAAGDSEQSIPWVAGGLRTTGVQTTGTGEGA